MDKEIQLIINKYINNKCTPDQLQVAMEIFSDPNHNLGIRPVLYTFWENDEKLNSSANPFLGNPEILLDKIHHQIHLKVNTKNNHSSKSILNNVLKIAAVLIFGLLTGILLKSYEKQKPVCYSAHVPKGSISQMVLPDNSVVYLNSGTELRYKENNKINFLTGNKGQRDVFLTGEAWFDVSKNEKKPFVVHTPFHSIKVTGTKFNTKAYPEDEEAVTTLEKGSIVILNKKGETYHEIEKLAPGQQLVYSKNDQRVIRKVIPERFSSWKENKLIFVNMNLKNLFILLERKYGVDIDVADNMVLEYHYDATITNESILDVLDLIGETLPIKYKIEGQKIIIHKK